MKTHRLILGLFLAVIAWPSAVSASTLLSQAYTTDGALTVGSLVSLEKGSTTHIKYADIETAGSLIGVVVNSDNSQLTISSGGQNQAYVATSGIEPVLVSDINGKIGTGDPITASPISGIGMLATGNAKIIGVAQDSFPNSTAKKTSYKDDKGKETSVILGQVPVSINVAYYYKQPEKTVIPSAIQNIANALAGKQVDSLPVLISMGIFIVAIVSITSIIYSMIRSSIISVGRNPMSQSAIYRNVMQLSALVVGILALATGSIYMVLTRF
ncbi:MAG TPA: hypothetical protein VFW52_01495 [Candidatus Saccharimonadales bacterium]|nr:hypothetical protein [Candidatus Saccharimonadales bacterium]